MSERNMQNDAIESETTRHRQLWKSLRAPKILVVDDDPLFGELALVCAEKLGVSACLASSYASAIACLNVSGVDVAIIDFDLGFDGTGVELAREVPNLPTLLMSRSPRYLNRGRHDTPQNIQATALKSLGVLKLITSAIDIYLRKSA